MKRQMKARLSEGLQEASSEGQKLCQVKVCRSFWSTVTRNSEGLRLPKLGSMSDHKDHSFQGRFPDLDKMDAWQHL